MVKYANSICFAYLWMPMKTLKWGKPIKHKLFSDPKHCCLMLSNYKWYNLTCSFIQLSYIKLRHKPFIPNHYICNLYLICIFMNINESLKMRKYNKTLAYFKPKQSLVHVVKSLVIQFDMVVQPMVLLKLFCICILLNINDSNTACLYGPMIQSRIYWVKKSLGGLA